MIDYSGVDEPFGLAYAGLVYGVSMAHTRLILDLIRTSNGLTPDLQRFIVGVGNVAVMGFDGVRETLQHTFFD